MNVEKIMESIKEELYGATKLDEECIVAQIEPEIENPKLEETVSTNLNLYCAKRLDEYKMKEQLVIFGAGVYGKKIYDFLCRYGCQEKVVAFCDNNAEKNTSGFAGVPILSVDDVIAKFPNATFIITPKGAENEITRQLVHLGVSIDNISIFIYLLAAI